MPGGKISGNLAKKAPLRQWSGLLLRLTRLMRSAAIFLASRAPHVFSPPAFWRNHSSTNLSWPPETTPTQRCESHPLMSSCYIESWAGEFAHPPASFSGHHRSPASSRVRGFPGWKTRACFAPGRKARPVPMVDAGMRELGTGWMHNRVHMIVGSFLVKHLLIRWQEGAKWFWDTWWMPTWPTTPWGGSGLRVVAPMPHLIFASSTP